MICPFYTSKAAAAALLLLFLLGASTVVQGSESEPSMLHNLRRTTAATTTNSTNGNSANAAAANVAVGSITKLRLINADTNLPIAGYDPLPTSATTTALQIDLNTLPTPNLSIEAMTSGNVASVGWDFASISRTENAAPWAMCFNNGADFFACQKLVAGFDSTIFVTPFALKGGQGTRGTPLSLRLSLVQGTMAPTTMAPVTLTPTKAPVTRPTRAPRPPRGPTAACNRTIVDYINSITLSNQTLTESGTTPEDKALQAVAALDLSPCIATDRLELTQKFALLTLYLQDDVFNMGVSWSNTQNWNVADASECTWFGITCNAQGAVTALRLANNGLVGTFPPDLGLLNSMVDFDIDDNVYLRGTLPSTVSRWTNLQTYHAYKVFLGPAPNDETTLAAWSNVQTVRASFWGGSQQGIPTAIANWTKIRSVVFDSHGFVGTLPSLLGRWTDIQHFELGEHGYQLTGSIPTELGAWTNVETARFRLHDFTGAVPSTMEQWTKLQTLDLTQNRLTGTIPSALCNLPQAVQIAVDCGWVSCACCSCSDKPVPTPTAAPTLTKLPTATPTMAPMLPTRAPTRRPTKAPKAPTRAPTKRPIAPRPPSPPTRCTVSIADYINRQTLSNRTLTIKGSTPEDKALKAVAALQTLSPCKVVDQFRLLQKFALLTLYYQVHVDPSFDITQWRVSTNWNDASKDECTWFGITCAPVTIEDATTGETLTVSGVTEFKMPQNDLVGTVPADLGHLTHLQHVDIHFNYYLRGTLPETVSRWSNLQTLNTLVVFFAPPMPSTLGAWTNLQYLNSSWSGPGSGTIPSYFGDWTKLKTLHLNSYGFVGSLPTLLGRWTDMEHFSLTGWTQTGSIPSELGSWTNLERFLVRSIGFSGTLPSSLNQWTRLKQLDVSFNDLQGSIPPTFCKLVPKPAMTVDCSKLSCTCCTCSPWW